jgi:hypothetical protein
MSRLGAVLYVEVPEENVNSSAQQTSTSVILLSQPVHRPEFPRLAAARSLCELGSIHHVAGSSYAKSTNRPPPSTARTLLVGNCRFSSSIRALMIALTFTVTAIVRQFPLSS